MPGTQRSVTLRFMAAPTDGNVRDRVGGGRMLEWIDKSGYACAAGWSGTYCVTAYVGNIHFTRPVEVGDLVYTEDTDACRETLRFMAAPTDVNWGGKVHGGIVMRWIDEAATLVAERWHRGSVIAVYAGGVRFYRPLLIGAVVEVEARLIYTGHSSMHVSVHVRSGNPRTGEMRTTTHCTMVLVALDEDGHKQHVRSWNPQRPEDLALQEHAKALIDIRERLRRPIPAAAPDAPH